MQRALVSEIFKLNHSCTVDSLLTALAAKKLTFSRATVVRTLKTLELAEMVRNENDTYTLR